MICRNCKFSLNGSEKFCPNCGAPLSKTEKDISDISGTLPEPPKIFFTPVKKEEARETYTEKEDISSAEAPAPKKTKKKKNKSSSKAPVALMLMLLLVILTTALVVAAERLDVAPAIMQYLKAEPTDASSDTLYTDYQKSNGTISPDISYSPTAAYVSESTSLALRHGPDNSYGLITTLRSGCRLQILGGTSLNERWIYVYVPLHNCYGWLNASFITLGEALDEVTEITDPAEEPTTVIQTQPVTEDHTTKEQITE